jgi:hypothetical protein
LMTDAEALLARVIEGIGLGLAVRGRADESHSPSEFLASLDQRR